MFGFFVKHPKLGHFTLRLPIIGIRYARWQWCQRRPVGQFADVIGLRRVM